MTMNVGGKGQKADINVTPMIDVLLVLIIIFMLIAPIAPKGLEAVASPASEITKVESREIVISVAKDGAIEINRQAVALDALATKLADLFRRQINDHVFVRGDGSLEYQAVAQVIDVARGAGWERVGLMTQ
jgi:biopolymer transport protein ExbD